MLKDLLKKRNLPPVPSGTIKVKKGFRSSKKRRHTYELELELTYKGTRLGIIPVNVASTSRAAAKKIIQNEIGLTVHKCHRKKGT